MTNIRTKIISLKSLSETRAAQESPISVSTMDVACHCKWIDPTPCVESRSAFIILGVFSTIYNLPYLM